MSMDIDRLRALLNEGNIDDHGIRKLLSAESSSRSTGGSVAIYGGAVAIIALVIACVCTGLMLMMPAYIEAQVAKGVAEAKADIAQQVADAKASADTGRQHARVALDKVEDFRAKLAEKGINVNLDGH